MIGLNRVIIILMKLVGWTIYAFLIFFLYLGGRGRRMRRRGWGRRERRERRGRRRLGRRRRRREKRNYSTLFFCLTVYHITSLRAS